MREFEILCVTMKQQDFSKLKEMNIHSDVIFANQANDTRYDELVYDGVHTARMITTQTRGVGINRNLALTYADAEICLFADDDVTYCNNMEQIVISEFRAHQDADVFIFHLDTDSNRKQVKYAKTFKHHAWQRMPWGAVRIAVRLEAVRKANVWFSLLFGGGCIFPSGEDSMWLKTAQKHGLKFYVSAKTIGKVSFEESTWFTGIDEKYFYGRGAYYSAAHPYTWLVWMIYMLFRLKDGTLTKTERLNWMLRGRIGYKKMKGYHWSQ